jgi:hypothetical protein
MTIWSTRRRAARSLRSPRRNVETAALVFQSINVARVRPMAALLIGIERMPQRLRLQFFGRTADPAVIVLDEKEIDVSVLDCVNWPQTREVKFVQMSFADCDIWIALPSGRVTLVEAT